MEKQSSNRVTQLIGGLCSFLRRCICLLLSIGPIPKHVAFIMDGNRRFAKRQNIEGGSGHKAGFSTLMKMLKYCYEFNVKYVTIYAFSIENFKRRPEEVQSTMGLIQEKIEGLIEEESIVNRYGVRVHFIGTQLIEGLCSFLRRCICLLLSIGPIPKHVAFIMDGNRRYAKRQNIEEGSGHKAGFSTLMKMLKYCYEFNVKYVTIYAFSIENFKRRPEEVQTTMDLIQEKIEGLIEDVSIVNRYGVRVHFIGNLKLLSKPVKSAVERAMKATACNSKAVLLICIAYTSTDEILHAVGKTCGGKRDEFRDENECLIDVADVDRHMYMAVASDPEIIIRTSGETRLSDFLLWQSAYSLLYSPGVLWPDIGFRHLVRAVLDFQMNFAYLEKKRKQS